MRLEEAKKLLLAKYANNAIGKITETDNNFVFELLPNNILPYNVTDICEDDGLKAVNKKTGQIFTYNPIRDN